MGQPALLLEFRVFGFGLLEDGDVGVGVFPEAEEILVRGAGFLRVAGKRVGAGQAQARESADGFVENCARMVDDLLELSRGGAALPQLQISLTANVGGIAREKDAELIGRSRCQRLDCIGAVGGCLVVPQFEILCALCAVS
jgi:hypothetical protein